MIKIQNASFYFYLINFLSFVLQIIKNCLILSGELTQLIYEFNQFPEVNSKSIYVHIYFC